MAFNSFKNILKDYFTFTNRERKPIFIFLAMIIALLITLYYLRFVKTESTTDFTQFEKDIAALEKRMADDSIASLEKRKSFSSDKKINTPELPAIKISLFDFNPNNLPDSLWRKLGISEKTIRTIKNYESKGGKFYKKEDVKKIYGLHENDYIRLESFIVIPKKISISKQDSVFEKTEKPFYKKLQPLATFDLNSVSAEELKTIYGIGDFRANAIIKYRSMLGGYFLKEQLLEVYGIDSIYPSIENQLEVKTKNLRTININTAYEPELKHPYISKQFAILLVNYRKMHGNFKSVEEIKNLPLLNDELYRKLAPYLSVE